LPPYLKRSKSVEELIPWLYLKGISTGDYSESTLPNRFQGSAVKA
jgi:putative transposase